MTVPKKHTTAKVRLDLLKWYDSFRDEGLNQDEAIDKIRNEKTKRFTHATLIKVICHTRQNLEAYTKVAEQNLKKAASVTTPRPHQN